MNELFQKLAKFFEEDVSDAIPALVKEYQELTSCTDEEAEQVLKNSKLKIMYKADDELEYWFMSEPYVSVNINKYLYTIRIADQQGEIMHFRTSDFNMFVRCWNSDVVGYYGQDAKFPEMNIRGDDDQ